MSEAERPSNRIDLSSPTANMFGIEPCPRCGDKYRYILKDEPDVIRCDNCGLKEAEDRS